MKSSEQKGKTLPVVQLRALEPEDLDLLYRIENDRELWDCSATNVPYSRHVLSQYILSAQNNIFADGQVRLIVENEAGEVVGVADLTNFDSRHQRAEVGLVVLADYRRKGYAPATLERLLGYSQRILHLHQLYVCVSVDNQASVALFRKAGFSATARLKEWLCMDGVYTDALWMQYIL